MGAGVSQARVYSLPLILRTEKLHYDGIDNMLGCARFLRDSIVFAFGGDCRFSARLSGWRWAEACPLKYLGLRRDLGNRRTAEYFCHNGSLGVSRKKKPIYIRTCAPIQEILASEGVKLKERVCTLVNRVKRVLREFAAAKGNVSRMYLVSNDFARCISSRWDTLNSEVIWARKPADRFHRQRYRLEVSNYEKLTYISALTVVAEESSSREHVGGIGYVSEVSGYMASVGVASGDRTNAILYPEATRESCEPIRSDQRSQHEPNVQRKSDVKTESGETSRFAQESSSRLNLTSRFAQSSTEAK
ncbi:uncharacterized protein PITG_11610 [Phytophthora infestans T30-4]|uniref:Uncharacterized protein n=2 Tax=Phytophthora infestans (strain T30-4) TaxID=403677 RepID=D0NI56_PHYIT|nr:uncharacterized protein PITG_11610 [Phytophthora infestans T30-4]EEY59141.1 conserved hypothetical protein [Phytophthora infestans T30-4]|eukprot:XP_002901155.1 conserved hypothetical protein [Phytophthora infestans T30-4]